MLVQHVWLKIRPQTTTNFCLISKKVGKLSRRSRFGKWSCRLLILRT
ncbi:hypothetical protein AWRI1631_123090 [Saccharomyces cerevisiae AWRI1631]|uniref:Uncharacterized protein n=1 Tax=Saccharomyces cerevisiae (strain AWRI1631) TaxID=545124 RepID=B5VNH9_YEAS6|nr:hypothetical protein AWRI1631_123090 [Saccharomyces cerevisiae AWRI1631]